MPQNPHLYEDVEDELGRVPKSLVMWSSARKRAKQKGLEFNIELSDIVIPEYCPVLGMKLSRKNSKQKDNSPSLDRIDNTKGYVKGNVIVVSYKANRLKSDATMPELQHVVNFYTKLLENRYLAYKYNSAPN